MRTYCRQRGEPALHLYLEAGKTSPCLLADEVGTYLYEPNAAILKAGAFRSLAQTYPVAKLHLNSHLYTSVSLVPDFPGRRFRVEAVSGLEKGIESVLDGYGQGEYYDPQLSIIGCGTSQTFETEEGGDDYIFATTLSGGQKVLIRGKKC